MAREMIRRRKLQDINTMEDVVRLLKNANNILVLTGAGVSLIFCANPLGTGADISGYLDIDKPRHTWLQIQGQWSLRSLDGTWLEWPTGGIRHWRLPWRSDVWPGMSLVAKIACWSRSRIFYSIAKDILPTTERFSPTHAFIELLQSKNKLLTQYTQNIDNLETRAGVKPEKLIQCHGSFATATCTKCSHTVPGETIFPDLRAGMVARCGRCLKEATKAGKKRKRTSNKASGRESLGGGRKQRYSEDSSADEEESGFQEAGVMKVCFFFSFSFFLFFFFFSFIFTSSISARYHFLWWTAPRFISRQISRSRPGKMRSFDLHWNKPQSGTCIWDYWFLTARSASDIHLKNSKSILSFSGSLR